jgi:methionyl-tRNA formyltransferase
VTQWKPDIAVVVAYGRLLSPDVLASVAGGWWNAHFSLLPLWRGAAPVPHAILAGNTTTGVTLFRLDQGLDTGDIAATIRYDIAPHDTTGSVLATLGEKAAAGIVDLLKSFAEGSLITHAQQGHATYAPKPAKDFGALDLTADAASIDRRFRAATPEPGAYVHRSDTGDRINILQMRPSAHERSPLPAGELRLDDVLVVGTGGDPLELERVQPAGKKPMSAHDWFRGLPEGVVLHG